MQTARLLRAGAVLVVALGSFQCAKKPAQTASAPPLQTDDDKMLYTAGVVVAANTLGSWKGELSEQEVDVILCGFCDGILGNDRRIDVDQFGRKLNEYMKKRTQAPIMLANVAERRREIGLRRALGATKADIVRLFIGESTLLCGIGGVLGLACGVGLADMVGTLAQWTVYYRPVAFPLGFGVAVVVGLLFGTLPAFRAAKLDPVLALRAE